MEQTTTFPPHEIEGLIREHGLADYVPKTASVVAQSDGSYVVSWEIEPVVQPAR